MIPNLRFFSISVSSLSFFWILLTMFPIGFIDRDQKSIDNLKILDTWVVKFQSHYSRLPIHIAELRAFVRSMGSNLVPYDPWGSRIYYQTLSESWYFIKSFGEDREENYYGENSDLSRIQMPPLAKNPPVYLTDSQSNLNLYPGTTLLGLKAASSPLVAELAIDRNSFQRRLVIRSLKDSQFILVSFHDAVQEFFWLPSSKQILYTASKSERYEEGIYIWDLIENTSQNLLPKFQSKFPNLKNEHGLYIALSANHPELNKMHALIVPKGLSPLDPKDFYHTRNLYEMTKTEEYDSVWFIARDNEGDDHDIFQRIIEPNVPVNYDFIGTPAQNDWLKLSNKGSVQGVLEMWQEYCIRYADTPVFPYSLWWLASLYRDTFHLMNRISPEEAHILRNFGVEISQALDRLGTAPDYLRSMGLYLKSSLLEKKMEDYQVSKLHP